MATIDRFSTSGFLASDRLALWNEASESAFGTMVVDAERDAFQGTFTRLMAGQLEIISVKSTPVVARSTRPAQTANPTFLIQMVHSGRCLLRHNGFEKTIVAGDLVIIDLSKPYDLTAREAVHGLTIPLPWERFGPFAEALDLIARRGVNVSTGAGAVLSTFLRSMWDQLADGDGQDWPESAEPMLWDLVQMVIDGSGEAIAGKADRLRYEAKAYIEAHLFDPDFSAAEIGEALGVGSRYLQLVFAQVGTTPSRYILSRRLEIAAENLRRCNSATSVTAVAFDSGFNDLSYFSRSFRKRFHVSPRAYRRGASLVASDWL